MQRGLEAVTAKMGVGRVASRVPTKTTPQRRGLSAPPKAAAPAIAPVQTAAPARHSPART